MTTTIMISTRVKPDLRFVLIRIVFFTLLFLTVGVNKTGSGYLLLRQLRSRIAALSTDV